jgi:hypothetical protein
MRGEDWLLSSYGCDYVVADDLSLTEVCDAARITGANSIFAIDDEFYVAQKDGSVARFGADSPALGDAPEWTAQDPADGADYFYDTYNATLGTLGSIVTGGSYGYTDGMNWFYFAYVRRLSSGGNPVNSNQFSELENINFIDADSNGAIVVAGYDSSGTDLMRLNSQLNTVWSIDACSEYAEGLVIDSADQIIVECSGPIPERYLRKLDSTGNELWRTDLVFEFDPSYGRLGVDSTDHIVRAAIEYENGAMESRLRVEKFAP